MFSISKPEIDAFWDDCIKQEKKNKKKEQKSFHGILKNNSNSYIAFTEQNDSNVINKMQRKKNNILKKHKLLEKILRTEKSIPANKEKSRRRQIEILTSMYNKNILEKQRKNKELENIRKQKELDELKYCSFKPSNEYKFKRRNKSYDEKNIRKYGEKNIYERDKIRRIHFEKKIKELKKESIEFKEEENEINTFKPDIKPKNLGRVLSQNNIWEKKANNISNGYFLWRYMKARKEESNKKKRLVWSMDKKDEEYFDNINYNNLSHNKIVQRSISQKDSLLYKKSLHLSLMSFKANNDNDNNESKEQ